MSLFSSEHITTLWMFLEQGDAGRHLLHADDTDGRRMTELHLITHTAVYTAGGNYACRH